MSQKIIYLDNAATTRPYAEVVEKMNKVLDEDYGNPSSMHTKGYDAEKYVKEARDIISKSLKVDSKEIYFTSGGTESNNTALIGCALAMNRKGKHIISTRIEHASVYNPLFFLEETGYEIEFLEVDSMGKISIEDLKSKIRKDTIIVSTMMVNNEVGAIQDIEAIGKVIKEIDKNILFHVDAIQAYGKLRIYPKKMNIDLLSISGHKLHGPKGVGVLYMKDKTKIRPLIHGGGQEKGLRSGTENVAGIAGMGEAAKLAYDKLDEKIDAMYELKAYMVDRLSNLEDVKVNAVGEDIRESAPHVVSVSFKGVRSEVLLHSLEEKGVFVSSGSACSSNHPAISGTLKAIGVAQDMLDSTIRFSFCFNTTKEEVDYAIKCVEELLPMLRRYTRH